MTTRVSTVADGVTTLFSIPFPYLDKSHVKVMLNGVTQPASAYTWVTSATIRLVSTPAGGVKVTRYRETPSDALTVYQSGSVLTRDQLEVDSLQALYRTEEAEAVALRLPADHVADTLLPPLVPAAPLVVAGDGTGFVMGSTTLTGDMALRGELASTGAGKGAELVQFTDPVAPAYLKTLSDLAVGAEVSALRAIPRTLHADIIAGTSTTRVDTYINDLLAGVNTHKRGDIYIPRGDYVIGAPMTYQPRTLLRGAGAGSSRFKVDPAVFPTTGGIYQILRNSNYATATGLEDGFVVVDGLSFDYNGLPAVAGGGSHAFTARYLRHVRILNCHFKGGENATALLACDDTLTQGCTSIDPENAGFDSWDGFSVAKVIGCTVRRESAGVSPDQGILFTADPSSGAARASSHIICIGNHVDRVDAASATGILVNAINAGNTVRHAVIEGNTITDSAVAVVIQGNVANGSVKGNAINGGSQAISVKAAASGSPNNITIEGNAILNPSVTAGDVAVISTAGDGVHVLNNTIAGSSYPYAIWQQASGIVSGNSFATGTSGRVLDGSGGTALILDNDTVNARHDFNKKLRTPGVLFGSDTANANLLDDYEEGVWTPTDVSGAGLVFTAAEGVYTKVGRLVSVQGRVIFPTTADATGASIGGLPFAGLAGSEPARAGGAIAYTTETTAFSVLKAAGASSFTVRSNSGASVTNATLSGDTLFFSFQYPTD